MKNRPLVLPVNRNLAVASLSSFQFLRLRHASARVKLSNRELALFGVMLVAFASPVQAATLIKSDTATMNLAADWGGTAPAAGQSLPPADGG